MLRFDNICYKKKWRNKWKKIINFCQYENKSNTYHPMVLEIIPFGWVGAQCQKSSLVFGWVGDVQIFFGVVFCRRFFLLCVVSLFPLCGFRLPPLVSSIFYCLCGS